jgi:endonuclease IV
MKIGVKTYDNKKFLDYFKDKCDFFEIMAIEGNDYDFLTSFNKELVIHAQHRRFGINNADSNIMKKNISSIDFARKIADKLDSKKIILHPGELTNEFCSKKNSIELIKSLDDKRILIENIPIENNFKRLCENPEETKEYLKKTNKRLCLDINHALTSAIMSDMDPIKFIKEFLKLKPRHFHIGGQNIKQKIDHICFSDSDFDLKEIIDILPDNAELTLETETDIKKTEEDIKIIKKLIR